MFLLATHTAHYPYLLFLCFVLFFANLCPYFMSRWIIFPHGRAIFLQLKAGEAERRFPRTSNMQELTTVPLNYYSSYKVVVLNTDP